MKLQILEESEAKLRLRLTGIDRSYANGLRRLMISEVPTMAIDEVVILENSSVMYDELIAHRLGLVPLRTDLTRHILPENCDCGSPLGCSKCRVLLVLDAEAQDRVRTVYTGDLVSEDALVRPVSEAVPIVRLAPGQKIKLEAYAKLGRGREHAKWQATSASVLKQLDGADSFELYVESAGGLPAREVFLAAVDLLEKKLAALVIKSSEVKLAEQAA